MAATRLVLETDILVSYLRRRSDLLERVLTRFNCALTAITVYELEIGLARAPQQVERFGRLLDLVTVLPFDRAAAHWAAVVYEQLRAEGEPIGVPDTLIAGTCIACGVPLLTGNEAHYRRVQGLTVVDAGQIMAV